MSYSRLKQNFGEPRGTSSAVASVLYSRGGDGHAVTKSGSYIYCGDAANYHEWEFRTKLRVKSAGDEILRSAGWVDTTPEQDIAPVQADPAMPQGQPVPEQHAPEPMTGQVGENVGMHQGFETPAIDG